MQNLVDGRRSGLGRSDRTWGRLSRRVWTLVDMAGSFLKELELVEQMTE